MKTTKEEIAKIAERENLNADALYQACDNALGFSVRAVGTNNVPEELAIGATVVAVKHYLRWPYEPCETCGRPRIKR